MSRTSESVNNPEMLSPKLFDSSDADMTRLLEGVARKVTRSVDNADRIHRERLQAIRTHYARS